MSKALQLTSKLVKDYEEYTTHRGEVIKVHSVPSLIFGGIKTEQPKPQRPKVKMQTKLGEQLRWAKEGDPEWDEYITTLEEWKQEQSELENAVSKVLALRSYNVDDTNTILNINATALQFPDYILSLVSSGLLEIPENQWKRKEFWLDTWVLSQQDDINISWILRKLSGVPEDLIEQMKASFRNQLLEKASGVLGGSDSEDSQAKGLD